MNPISSGSQTPKRCWQEPQLPSQQWPRGGGGARACGNEEKWLLLRSPHLGAGVQPRGCCVPGPACCRGGGAGSADSVRAPAAAPGSVPAICLSLRPAGEGEGRPDGPGELPEPRASGPPAQGLAREGHAPGPPSRSPSGARGSRSRGSRPPPSPVTDGPAERRRAANGTPTPTPVTT